MLSKCLTLAGLRKALSSLPKTLDETYSRVLLEIEEDYRREAYAALQWLAFSLRPLTIDKVAEAVVIRPGHISLGAEEKLRDLQDILSICSSLVVLSEQRELRLAHYSVKEFLVSGRIRTSSAPTFAMTADSANKTMAVICLAYLLLFDQTGMLTDTRLEDFPLLHYSAQNWYKHAQCAPAELAEKDIVSLALQLLNPNNRSAFTNWLAVSMPDRVAYTHWPQQQAQITGSPLYYASYCGMLEVARRLLHLGEDVNAHCGVYGNALKAAAHTGNVAMVRLLVDGGARIDGRSANNQHSIEERLLHMRQGKAPQLGNRTDVVGNYQGMHMVDKEESPLEVMKQLNPDAAATRQDWAHTLQLAASAGDVSAVELLLADQSAVQDNTTGIQLALQEAASAGHQNIMVLLLRKGADAYARGAPFGSAPEAALSQWRDGSVVNLVKFGYRALESVTALHLTASSGHAEVARCLIDQGADMEAKNPLGMTPLHCAAGMGHIEVMKIFLHSGASPNGQDCAGCSPLHFAAYTGQDTVIQTLLDAGADVNAKALFRYTRQESTHSEPTYLERRCAPGRTPLHEAAWAGQDTAIRLLVDRGGELSVRDDNGETAMQTAAKQGFYKTVHLLMYLGAR